MRGEILLWGKYYYVAILPLWGKFCYIVVFPGGGEFYYGGKLLYNTGTPFCSFTQVTMKSQRKAQRFPRRQRVFRDIKENITGMFLFKMHISTRYEKNNQVPMLNPDRKISVSGDTMSHPSLGYRLDWYLWHRITLDWDLSVWIQHWYLILLIFCVLMFPLNVHRIYHT